MAALCRGGGGRGQMTSHLALINGWQASFRAPPTAPSGATAATAARAPRCVAAWRAAARAWRGGAACARRRAARLALSGWLAPAALGARAATRAAADARAGPRRLHPRAEGVVRARRRRSSRRRSAPERGRPSASGVGQLSTHRAPQPPAGAAPARWARWAAARALIRRRRAGTALPPALQALGLPLLRNGRPRAPARFWARSCARAPDGAAPRAQGPLTAQCRLFRQLSSAFSSRCVALPRVGPASPA